MLPVGPLRSWSLDNIPSSRISLIIPIRESDQSADLASDPFHLRPMPPNGIVIPPRLFSQLPACLFVQLF